MSAQEHREAILALQGRNADLLARTDILRTISDNIPGLVAYWTADLRCAYSNEKYLEWFGRTPAEMNGIPMRELLGDALFGKNEAYIRGALRGEAQRFERTLTKPNGEVGYTWAQYIPHTVEGAVLGFVVLVSDITAIKTEQEKLRVSDFALNAVSQGVFITDVDGRVRSVNPAFCAQTGYSAADVQGRPFAFLLGPSPDAQALQALNGATAGGKEYAGEILSYRQDGSAFWNDLTFSPVLDESNRITHFVGVTRDVSARKKAELELQSAKEKAESANLSKDEFLATMSHEIRTPMNGLLGLTQILELTELTAEQRMLVQTIKTSGDALLVILNDILDLSKIEAGKLDIERIPFEPRGLLRDILLLLAVQAERKGLRLETRFGEGIPERLLSDPGRIRQILFNLVGNAVKFTSQGKVSITVTRDGAYLKFEIEDTGIGISADKQALMFGKFSQADASTSRKFGGTGLGLAISKRLTDLLGGEIGFHSEPGKGTVFWVRLPMVPHEPGSDASNAGSAASNAGSAASNGVGGASVPDPDPRKPRQAAESIRILVAEDSEINRMVSGMMLEKIGCPFDFASNGREAVELAFRNRYALILMDCEMPEQDGYSAALEIRRREKSEAAADPDKLKRRTILALTANPTPSNQERCLACGMDGFITKPVQLDTIREAIRTWVP